MSRRVFYDWEFIDNGRTIDPISIGMVDGSGYSYYAIFRDAPWEEIAEHSWLMDHVVPRLPLDPENPDCDPHCGVDLNHYLVKPAVEIAADVTDFLLGRGVDELWGDYVSYDHVLLCQLLGPRMVELPAGVPWWSRDIRQLVEQAELSREELPVQEFGEHHALDDARHNRRLWQFCTEKLLDERAEER